MEKYQDSSFGDRLKKARGKRTQAELAALVGVGQGTIAKYEKGMIPQADILLRISNALGVTSAYLLECKSEQVLTTKELPETYGRAKHPDAEIEAVIRLMEGMDSDTKKDVRLGVQKEKLLRDLLSQYEDKKAG
jgi:transcriptional regulator with XRE-family HTH domain